MRGNKCAKEAIQKSSPQAAKRALQKSPTKEPYQRALQKSPTKEPYQRALQKSCMRRIKCTKRALPKSPTKEEPFERDPQVWVSLVLMEPYQSALQKSPTKVPCKRALLKCPAKEPYQETYFYVL